MKLKRVEPVKINKKSSDDLYHCCRWCHYFDTSTKTCLHENIGRSQVDINMYAVSENGLLDGVLNETFDEVRDNVWGAIYNELIYSCKISGSKLQKIKAVYDEARESYLLNLKEKTDIRVSNLYENYFESNVENRGFEVEDYENYSCQYWR